jgi:type IV pilus assembly protein PilM
VARPAIAGGVVLIDIGANTTSVVMLMDGVPQFVRIIPAGGYDLTSSLRSTLEIDTAEAEAIKRRLGLRADLSQPEDRASMEVIYRVTGELLNGLRNTVSFFVNARPEHPIERIVLTGGGSTMTGMADALAQMTGVPVTMADPFESVSVSGKLHIDELRRQSSGLSVALGLAVGTVAA